MKSKTRNRMLVAILVAMVVLYGIALTQANSRINEVDATARAVAVVEERYAR